MAEYHLGVSMTKLERQRKSKFKYELAIFLSIPLFFQGASPYTSYTARLIPAAPVAPMAINLATSLLLWPMKPFIQWCASLSPPSSAPLSSRLCRYYYWKNG